MNVIVTWTAEASQQYHALSQAEQQSVLRVQTAIRQSPRAGYVYKKVQQEATGQYRTIWVAWGFQVQVLYTLSGDRRGIVACIQSVAPSELPGITEYEERTSP